MGRLRMAPLTVIAFVVLCGGVLAAPRLGTSPAGAAARATVPTPTVDGPILPTSGISYLGSTTFDPSAVGYEESEFFLSGTATAYKNETKLSENGKWSVVPATTAPYTTREVVYRPIDPSRFDGTVVVEWLNVTGGIDAPAAWLNAHIQMIRDGMAFIGVDAQSAGIYGEAGSIATEDGIGGLKQTDPTRYAPLNHPGDSYSYSIYAQAGQAVRSDGTRLLSGLTPKHVIALGESQSAIRLTTYIDAVAPLAPHVYDAYFVYSRGGNGADLSQSPQPTLTTPTPTFIRTDLHTPVFMFETESDLLGLGYLPARQPPTSEIREWETAGTAHDDTYGLLYSRADTGDGSADTQAFDSMLNPPKDPIPGIVDCAAPINAGSHTYELRAALQAVNRWVTSGHPPPESSRLEIDPSDHSKFATNAMGEALGGIRTPQVVAPVATLSGIGQPSAAPTKGSPGTKTSAVSGQALCAIFGTTVPLSSSNLAQLYPSHADFVKKWDDATAAEVKEGYLLPADSHVLDQIASKSSVGG
jgi:Alpha/beta hydrolase domain